MLRSACVRALPLVVLAVLALGQATAALQCAGRGWLEIGLHNRNMAAVHARALAAADPDHRMYGKFLTFSEVKELVHDPASLLAVENYLRLHDIVAQRSDIVVSLDGQWVTVPTPVCNADAVASAVQADLAPHVGRVHVHAVDVDVSTHGVEAQYARGRVRDRAAAAMTSPDSVPSTWPPGPPTTTLMTLKDVRAYYNITEPSPSPPSGKLATAAVFEVNALEFNGEIVERYNPPDTASFQKLCGLPISPVTNFKGDNVTLGCLEYTCAEPNLDVELLRAIAPWATFTYWSTNLPNSGTTNAMLVWLMRLANDPSPSLVQSMSWGPGEAGHPTSLLMRMEEEFAKLAARGVTFVTSSGDDGVNDRTARGNPSACGLAPQYPATSAWVTTVGGTMGPEFSKRERTAATDAPRKSVITSGGGFSTVYPQPSYQRAAVQGYLSRMAGTSTLPPTSTFNSSNRAYPDVALLANNIDTIVNQAYFPGSGTSASAPLFAGMVTRVLQQRLDQGLPPLGLLNVRLYKLANTPASPFNDITVGDNHCTGIYGPQQNHTCCPYGFTATKGFDPLTGLGSVDYPKFLKALTTN